MSARSSTCASSRTNIASVFRLRVRANALDLAVYRRVRSLAHTPDHVRWVRRYSKLGEHGAVWLAFGAAATVGAAYAVSTSIKLAIGRQRPAIEDLPHLMATPTGLSFPSSHSTSSFAAARAFGSLLPPVPLYAAASAMAFSRLYLGVHYPSDIAAGVALGSVLGTLGR